MLLNKISRLEKTYVAFFIIFIFFSAIFCNISKVNLLFHASLIIFIATLLISKQSRDNFSHDSLFLKNLILPFLFLFYFTLSNLWSATPENITSTLKHMFYLLAFICIYRQVEKFGYKKHVMGAVFFGMSILSILTLIMVDKTSILLYRLGHGFPWAPDNVIDLGGYMAIGVFCGIIYIRETGQRWLYLLFPILLISLILTQSRGPFIAFTAAFSLLFVVNPSYTKKHILYGIALLFIILSLVYFTDIFKNLILRLENSYNQSFIRFGIWKHALEVSLEKPIWGWGYDKSLAFTNSIGEKVTTTHTIYLSSLLKGGVVGFLLMMTLIGYGILQIKKHLQMQQKAEASIFIFSLIYYMTQGMFIIGNPQEYWFLFWFPLAVILCTPIKNQFITDDYNN